MPYIVTNGTRFLVAKDGHSALRVFGELKREAGPDQLVYLFRAGPMAVKPNGEGGYEYDHDEDAVEKLAIAEAANELALPYVANGESPAVMLAPYLFSKRN